MERGICAKPPTAETVYHERMRHVVWGTAGHIDHGKTTLVKALTGTDCDRLPEERERGITIDLGFAQLSEDEIQLHFVDVPGHERLVHTMIAGASGIDLALLVVAADEGVMPQTREHLDVIRLMGVPGGAVALTKIDLMDDDLVELVTEEIRELLAPTAFAGVPVVPVSGQTGAGISELRRVLVEQAGEVRPRQVEGRPFREPVDRVFSLTGAGTVVTGTSLWGELEVGTDVRIFPHDTAARVRRLHVHGDERSVVEAGERVAINLAGVSRETVSRGDQIIAPGPWEVTQLVTVGLELLATAPGPMDEGDEVEVHALAARVPARVDRLSVRPLPPGSRATAQISLRQPMLLFPGDRLVLRRPSPVNTFAGGKVLDAHLRRWRRRDSAALDSLPDVQKSAWPDLLSSWIDRHGLAGLTVPAMAGRLGVCDGAIEAPLGRLLEEGIIQALSTQPPTFVMTGRIAHLADEAAQELERRLAGEEVSAGIPARDFAGQLLPRSALPLAEFYLEELRGRGTLELSEGRVVPPGKESHMTAAGEALTRKVEALYRKAGFDAPSPGEAADHLQARLATIEGICRYLTQRHRLVRLEGKFLIHRAVMDDMARQVREWEVEDFAVGDFKGRFGLTRKLAIPALEWLDSERVTVRHGNRRKIIRRKG
jgi:selenocysteine-specific elongation factor